MIILAWFAIGEAAEGLGDSTPAEDNLESGEHTKAQQGATSFNKTAATP
jgi:hypothetical protein